MRILFYDVPHHCVIASGWVLRKGRVFPAELWMAPCTFPEAFRQLWNLPHEPSCPLPPVLDEGVVVPCMSLATVDNHTHELVVFCRGNFLPRGASSPLVCVPAIFPHFWGWVLTSHPRHSVRFHVQHPGKLFEEVFWINQGIAVRTCFV